MNSTTELNSNDMILWFDDLGTGNEEYRFLSNFYEGEPISLPGVTWENLRIASSEKALHPVLREATGAIEFPTGEHAFAAMKAWGSDIHAFAAIASAKTPNETKARGRRCALRPDWEVVKLDVMAAVVRAKFQTHREEGQRLLATGDKMLVEGTYWQDTVWGVDLKDREYRGRNWLGTLLMARRAELRAYEKVDSVRVMYFKDSTLHWNSEFSAPRF